MREPALTVPLSGGRDYPIYIGAGNAHLAGEVFAGVARSKRAVIITQPKIVAAYAATLADSLERAGFAPTPVVTFPAGERFKTLATVHRLCEKIYDLTPKVDRKTLIVALGGGVVGDVAGFVAAVYLRGLDYVQVPTTLLAMVDSSVGGKTGVDFKAGKNLIGAFHQPRAVWIDTDTLATLPLRETKAGMAEVVKYGIIRSPELLDRVTREGVGLVYGANRDSADFFPAVIEASCRIKAEVVAHDEYETTGLRAILNYGHTVGHALEAATGYKRFKHGEAVAIGMRAAAEIGMVAGVTPPEVTVALRAALNAHGLPDRIPGDLQPGTFLPLLALDKKAEGGKARFVLARAVGDVALYADVYPAAVEEGIRRSYGE
jgi:3-dehydroquinate synthase